MTEMTLKLKVSRKSSSKKMMNSMLWDLPSASSMSYFWNFGSSLGMMMMVQLTTGLLLTTHYSSWAESSFDSVVSIMKEIWSGWLIRMIHMNGASMFFIFIYLHLFRGVFYFSAKNSKLWTSGIMILMLTMMISFLGYVLPWGQMSYWAVAVITNLLSIFPIIGENMVNWVWGAFSVSSPTLFRFYTLHFLTPFILLAMVMIHLVLLHESGSSNPLGINSDMDKVQFHPYFSVKDIFFIIGFLTVMMIFTLFYPFMLGDSINNVPANAMQTPIHIQPEWYFLPSYAILRSMPSKTTGVIALILSILIFNLLPMYNLKFSTKFNMMRSQIFWMMIASWVALMKLGSLPAEEPYIWTAKTMSMIYFSTIMAMNI